MIKVRSYRELLNTQRLQGHSKNRNYNLAEHQYFTTILFQKFSELEGIEYDLKALSLILRHDVAEILTSDCPFPVKNFNNITKNCWKTIENEICKDTFYEDYSDEVIKNSLTEEQHKMFKVCDLLELWIFCKEEQELGNKTGKIQNVVYTCEKLIRNKYRTVDEFMTNYSNNIDIY